MSQAASQARPVVRGPSRFRVRVQLILTGLRPYGWEIYDEEDGKSCAARRRGFALRPKAGTPAGRRCSRQTCRRQRRLTPAGRARNYHRAWRGRGGWW